MDEVLSLYAQLESLPEAALPVAGKAALRRTVPEVTGEPSVAVGDFPGLRYVIL